MLRLLLHPRTWPFPSQLNFFSSAPNIFHTYCMNCRGNVKWFRHVTQKATVACRISNQGNLCYLALSSELIRHGTVWMNSDRPNASSSHCPWRCGLANVRQLCKHTISQHASRVFSSKVNTVMEWLGLTCTDIEFTETNQLGIFFLSVGLYFVVSKWDKECCERSWGPG